MLALMTDCLLSRSGNALSCFFLSTFLLSLLPVLPVSLTRPKLFHPVLSVFPFTSPLYTHWFHTIPLFLISTLPCLTMCKPLFISAPPWFTLSHVWFSLNLLSPCFIPVSLLLYFFPLRLTHSLTASLQFSKFHPTPPFFYFPPPFPVSLSFTPVSFHLPRFTVPPCLRLPFSCFTVSLIPLYYLRHSLQFSVSPYRLLSVFLMCGDDGVVVSAAVLYVTGLVSNLCDPYAAAPK